MGGSSRCSNGCNTASGSSHSSYNSRSSAMLPSWQELGVFADRLQRLQDDHDELRREFADLCQRCTHESWRTEPIATGSAGLLPSGPQLRDTQAWKPNTGWRCSRRSSGFRDLYDMAEPLLREDSSLPDRSDALRLLRVALSQGVPLEWRGESTPLRAAVESGCAEFVALLLQSQADPRQCDDQCATVLHLTAFEGHAQICRQLLRARADANALNKHGQTPIFFSANSETCEALLEGRADVNATNGSDQTPLHHAGRSGFRDVLQWLVRNAHPDTIERRDVHGASAAYYARQAGLNPGALEVRRPLARLSQSVWLPWPEGRYVDE